MIFFRSLPSGSKEVKVKKEYIGLNNNAMVCFWCLFWSFFLVVAYDYTYAYVVTSTR